MEISSHVKRLLFKTCFVFLSCSVLLWFSVFSYGLLYYLYIPAIAHVKPVYLRYNMLCDNSEVCRFPHDNVTLVEKGKYELLSGGQAYAIEVVLDMPESEQNINQGMFMIKLDMLSESGKIIKSSYRPALLHYKSPLFKIIYTLFFAPGLLSGSVEEKQTLVISLFENFVENSHEPVHFIYIAVEAKTAEIYSASLRIHAQFTGLRYLMYYWPVLSALVGIATNFFLLVLVIALIWARQIANGSFVRHSSVDIGEQQKFTEEIRRAMQRKYSQKHTELKGEKVVPRQRSKSESRIKGEKIENLPLYREKRHSSISEEDAEQFEDAILVPDEGELSRSLRRKTEEIFGEGPVIIQQVGEEVSPTLRRRKITEQCETEL